MCAETRRARRRSLRAGRRCRAPEGPRARGMSRSVRTRPLLLALQLAPLLLDEAVQFVEQRAVAVAHGLDNAGEQRLRAAAAAFEQPSEHILGHAALELLARDARRVKVRAPLLRAPEQALLEEPVERRHPRRVRRAPAEGFVDVARTDATA